MTIVRDIVSEFSDEEEIEMYSDEKEVQFDDGSSRNLVVNLVSAYLSIPVKALVKEVVSHFGYTITYRKAWTAKQMALTKIYGDCEVSYNDLPRWMNALQFFCPDTIVKYEARHQIVYGMEDPSRIILDRIFWAFKPCVVGFAYCKSILQVDETFLTGKYTGTLLIASSQDENKRVFPVPFAIIEER
ncbi:PREDICTED: uncharacterized protein LOC109353988 [Lupinus angustifolius]|uniref:uncharacterized protein LOC109353988 n=1 Tax=Lupinus angustifolius TaxID=3871 RepID=UPI00092FCC98|nr:PREDICTED: uncharacterized protein LOC109353988 [Lupinus angustifolius]